MFATSLRLAYLNLIPKSCMQLCVITSTLTCWLTQRITLYYLICYGVFITNYRGQPYPSLRQINPHCAPHKGSTNGAVTQCRCTFCATTKMSTGQEENLRFIVHTDLALEALVFCSCRRCFWLHFCRHNDKPSGQQVVHSHQTVHR